MSTHTLHNDADSTNTTYDNTMARSMALNLADWHRASLQGFGVESFYTDALWWRQPGGSGIYLGAIVLDAQTPDETLFAELRTVQQAWELRSFGLYDCWATRDLAGVGFERAVKNPWYLREPNASPEPKLPDGLSIEIVTRPQQLADFEWASWAGFEEPDNPDEAFLGREPFSQHPLETLDDPGMYYLNARLDGQVVAGVIIHATEDMVGIYGISTLPKFRRRGYASALVRASLALRPELPVSVFPDPVSVPIYTDVGFVAAGEIAIWRRREAR
ncbi:MAG: GNAT family N-acetyltransferase [Caldilineaceae bacterium]|nr:GNAT family N-acetyltransferase [Caldilineaceae bacterium]